MVQWTQSVQLAHLINIYIFFINVGFAAYDPVFYLHHSNVDRQYAFWQNLQKIRGKSSEAIAKEYPLPPFNEPTVNPFYQVTGVNPTQQFSLNYEENYNYKERRKKSSHFTMKNILFK